jgi:protocatechuate 3,4-dioxygenase alpha subunit
MIVPATASQTVGPFLHIGLEWLTRDQLAPLGVSGERVTVEGRVLDGDGQPVTDAFIEVWQANAQGKYAHPEDWQEKPVDPEFQGFGRVPTDNRGAFRFTTVKPGRVPNSGGGLQAPHLLIAVFMRGLLKQLVTRLYFPDEPSNAADPVLSLVPAERRPTLIARGRDSGVLEWDVVLQGQDETVFFDV